MKTPLFFSAGLAVLFSVSASAGVTNVKKDSFAESIAGTEFSMGVAVERESCPRDGEIAMNLHNLMLTCQLGSWAKASSTPNMHRFVFNASQEWTVPTDVKSGFVTMAGGGGSGLGWRVSNMYMTGHSGGYVFNQPVNFEPGETISVVVGKGGIAFAPYTTGVMTGPYYIYTAPSGDDGTGGYPGSSSMLVRPNGDVLLECAGGSGATVGNIDHYSGSIVAGGVNGASVGSGVGPYPAPNRAAVGNFAHPGGPGACGPSLYGIGNGGVTSWAFSSGHHAGGSTPFGFGSGGSISISGCYINASSVGVCIFPSYGRDGVVMIDVMY